MLRTPLIAAVVVALTATSCGQPGTDPTVDDGFVDLEDVSANNETSNNDSIGDRVLTGARGEISSGAAAAVFFIDHAGVTHRRDTSADGTFLFDDVPAGQSTLVINDGRGRGVVQAVTLLAGGMNNLGAFELDSLEEFPSIVDLLGVGFEERVTDGIGNYKYPTYATDASKMWAVRQLGGEYKHDIVEVDTMTGAERVLLDDLVVWHVDQTTLREYNGGVPAFVEFGDKHLFGVTSEHLNAEKHAVIYDLEDDQVAYTSENDGLAAYAQPLVTDDAAYFVLQTAFDVVEVPNGPTTPIYQYALFRFDFATGTTAKFVDLTDEWAHRIDFVGGDDEYIVFTEEACTRQNRGCDFFDTVTHQSTVIDLATGTRRTRDYTNIRRDGFDPDDNVVWGRSSTGAQEVARWDLDTDRFELIPVNLCADCWVTDIATSPVADHVAVVASEMSDTFPKEQIFRVDVDGTTTALDPMVGSGADAHRLCSYGWYCQTVGFTPDGRLRVEEVEVGDDDVKPRFIVDIDPATAAIAVERFGYPDATPLAVLDAGPDHDVTSVRNHDDGFVQLSFRDGTAPARQLTFITANHEFPHFAPDGRTLFYLTRDPISGHSQLFRTDTATMSSLP